MDKQHETVGSRFKDQEETLEDLEPVSVGELERLSFLKKHAIHFFLLGCLVFLIDGLMLLTDSQSSVSASANRANMDFYLTYLDIVDMQYAILFLSSVFIIYGVILYKVMSAKMKRILDEA